MNDLQILLICIRHNILLHNFATNPSSFRTATINHLPYLQILLLDVVIVNIGKGKVIFHKGRKIKTKFKCINVVVFAQVKMLESGVFILDVIEVLYDGVAFNFQENILPVLQICHLLKHGLVGFLSLSNIY